MEILDLITRILYIIAIVAVIVGPLACNASGMPSGYRHMGLSDNQ